jgi:predicted dehydrogenase
MRAEAAGSVAGFLANHRPGEIAPWGDVTKTGGHAGLIADFIECIRSGRTPETIGSDNIKSLAMVFGAIESAEAGLPVSIQRV